MIVALDTETFPFRRGYMAPEAVCMSLAWDSNYSLALEDLAGTIVKHAGGLDCSNDHMTKLLVPASASAAVVQELLSMGHQILGHNIFYDLAVLVGAGLPVEAVFEAIAAGRIRDTRVREKLAAVATDTAKFTVGRDGKVRPKTYTLAALASKYLGVDITASKGPDTWRTRYRRLKDVPLAEWPKAAVDYAVDDAAYTLMVFKTQDLWLAQEVDGYPTRENSGNYFVSETREVAAAWVLHLGAIYGLVTDPEQVEATLADWEARSAAGKALGRQMGFIRTALYKRGPKAGTPTKRDGTVDVKALGALVDAAYQRRGGLTPTTPTGRVSVAEVVLRDSGDPNLQLYSESLSATNWGTKYAEILRTGTHTPITFSVDHLKTTGRVSVRNPPMQQPPREGGFRECFVPRRGFLYAQADYDQIELRALAQNHIWMGLGDTMARAFREGKDPHVMMAVAIMRADGHSIDYATAMEARKGAHGPEQEKLVNGFRQMAKAANFGFPGGLGVKTFQEFARSYRLDLSEDDVRGLKDLYMATWPEMKGYFEWVEAGLRYSEKFTVQQPMSRRVRGGCSYTSGANTLFQGLVADGFKRAFWYVQEECLTNSTSPLWRGRAVLPLHDEIIAEVREEVAPEAAQRMAELMRKGMQEHMPDVPVTIEAALMDRWYKGAKPAYNENGDLIPWRPKAAEPH